MAKGVTLLSGGALLVAMLTMLQPHLARLLKGSSSALIHYRSEQAEWKGQVTRLSWSPRAYHIKGLLTDEECEHIKKLAAEKLTASQVVDPDSPQGHSISEVRTSSGTFIDKGYDEVISGIEDRVAMITMLPKENFEDMQVLKYVDGQKYEPHHDWFEDEWNKRPETGGQRVVTMLMYLATPEEGGETVFPNVDPSLAVKGEGWSECAMQGLAHKPVKGDALMFYSLTPSGQEDEHSLHGSCPTLKGEKWSATFWIHVDKYLPDAKPPTATGESAVAEEYVIGSGSCVDTSVDCNYWADIGDCESNPQYMLEHCPYSCQVCHVPGNEDMNIPIGVDILAEVVDVATAAASAA